MGTREAEDKPRHQGVRSPRGYTRSYLKKKIGDGLLPRARGTPIWKHSQLCHLAAGDTGASHLPSLIIPFFIWRLSV